jgi:glucose/arabinose dehydrogenase
MLQIRPLAALSTSVVLLLTAGCGTSAAQLRATLVASGLSRPLGFVQVPSEPGLQVVLEQAGRVRVLRDGALQSTDFLDLRSQIASSGEQGLLGLAFAPDFASSGRAFVSFTNLNGHSVIARFTRAAGDPFRADPSSRFDLVWPDGNRFVTQPFANHNGGNIAFGPDGYLYFGLGDGGASNDPFHHAQHPGSLLGKMLRLNVNVPASDREGYDVPPTNPFVGRPDVLPEIWAFGLRNPWRWSFDDPARGGTGALVIADVGQNAWEEIDYEPAGSGGRNYGWRNREGAHDRVTSMPPFLGPLREPIYEYPQTQGRSITGGHIYRGTRLGAAFVGRYFFGDYVLGRIWSLGLSISPSTREATAGDLIDHTSALGSAASSVASFGVDASGELYIVSHDGGVYRLDGDGSSPPAPNPPPGAGPTPGADPEGTSGRRRGTNPATGTAQPRR